MKHLRPEFEVRTVNIALKPEQWAAIDERFALAKCSKQACLSNEVTKRIRRWANELLEGKQQ